jgi:hypothetical protein
MTECGSEIRDGMGVEWDMSSGMEDDRYGNPPVPIAGRRLA